MLSICNLFPDNYNGITVQCNFIMHFSLISFIDHLFNLKFAVKELERNSKKCEKEEKAEKLKTKKAIQKGNMEVNICIYFVFIM